VRRRLFTFASAVSLLLCVATMVLWVRSFWKEDIFDLPAGPRDLRVCSTDRHFVVVMSRIRPGNSSTRVHWGAFSTPEQPIENWWRDILTSEPWHGFAIDRSYENTWLLIPQWSVLTVVAMPFAAWFLLRLCRRGRPLGRCSACGYNLTGNISGVCPECGTPVSQKLEAVA
jgi:hypothetical protein